MFDLKTKARIEPSFSTVAVVRPNMNINILVIVCIVLGPRPSQLLYATYTLHKSMYYNKKKKQHKTIRCSPFHQNTAKINGCFVCKKFCAYDVLFLKLELFWDVFAHFGTCSFFLFVQITYSCCLFFMFIHSVPVLFNLLRTHFALRVLRQQILARNRSSFSDTDS